LQNPTEVITVSNAHSAKKREDAGRKFKKTKDLHCPFIISGAAERVSAIAHNGKKL
jgi:hypothetical protein